MATLLSLGLRPQGEDFNETGNGKSGSREYIAKYDGPVDDINDYELIAGLPAMYSPWDMGDHNDTFVTDRQASYHDPKSRSHLIINISYSSTDDNGRPFGSLLDETYQSTGGTSTGTRTYKIDDSYVDASNAIDSPIVPQLNQIWSLIKFGVRVVQHSSQRQKDGSYIVVASYSTSDFQTEEKSANPLEEPVSYRYTSNELETDIEYDQVTGELIKFTNKRPVFPLRKGRDDIGVITIVRNEPDFSLKRMKRFIGKTNIRPMQIDGDTYDTDEIYMKNITGDPFWDDEDNKFYKVVYTAWYHEDDWRDKIANADFRDVNGKKAVAKSGFEDTPTALDQNGNFILGDVPVEDQITLRPHRFKQFDLELLGL